MPADGTGARGPRPGMGYRDETKPPEVPDVPFRTVAKKFVEYYRPFTVLFVADLIAATILACVDLAFPQILNFFVRDFFVNSTSAILDILPQVAVAMIVLYLVRSGCQWFVTCWGHIMGARMEARMRMDLFEQYQRLSFNYYDRNNTGEMMSKLVTDLFDISEVAHHGPENLFIAAFKIIGSFVLLMMVNVPLTLVMLVVTVIMVAYSASSNYRKRSIFRENRMTMASMNARLQDSLGGIRIVKSFGNEAIEIERFGHTNELFIDTKERSYRFLGQFQMASSLFQGALYVTTIVGGGYFVATGAMPASDLILYALYIGIFIAPIEMLINFTETFQKGYAGFRRFVETLAERPGVENAADAVDLRDVMRAAAASEVVKAESADVAVCESAAEAPGCEGAPDGEAEGCTSHAPSVRYEGVRFSYSEGPEVLHGIDLDIPGGRTVALVGPSGGGKTTTCSLLPRFYDTTAGRVVVDGVDIRDVTLESLRATVGVVQQDVYLFEGTIRDNILYGQPDATEEQMIWAATQANIHDFVMSLEQGYDTFVGERGARLSGGQKQRVAIARVFLRNPRILVLDEATSALDNESESHVQAALDALSIGRTTLVIAHRLSTIRNADLIAVVDGGQVVERGTHDELMALDGIYARYYRMQFRTQ